jgi:hypothetical protein
MTLSNQDSEVTMYGMLGNSVIEILHGEKVEESVENVLYVLED